MSPRASAAPRLPMDGRRPQARPPAGPTLRARLRDRGAVFGAWTSIGHPSITEIFTAAGVDFVGIDLEHSTISQEQSQRIIAASQAGGAACLPRLSSHNAEQARRLLDSGADGVIVPNVASAAQIKEIVSWVKYPPLGARGYGVARAQGYGMNFAEYAAGWNERSIVIIQIESIRAVEAIDELLAHEAIDGVMVGPYDISGSLGIPGQLTHRRVTEACDRVVEACRRHSKGCGTQLIEPTGANVQESFEQGFTFVVLSSDVFLLWKWSERMRGLIQPLRRPRQTLPGRAHLSNTAPRRFLRRVPR